MIKIDFGMLELVNWIISRNVCIKYDKIWAEIDDHVSHTLLYNMAEFDGGNALETVQKGMEEMLVHKADIKLELDLMDMKLFCNLCDEFCLV